MRPAAVAAEPAKTPDQPAEMIAAILAITLDTGRHRRVDARQAGRQVLVLKTGGIIREIRHGTAFRQSVEEGGELIGTAGQRRVPQIGGAGRRAGKGPPARSSPIASAGCRQRRAIAGIARRVVRSNFVRMFSVTTKWLA